MHRLPALLFDLDGTLFDSAHGVASALTQVSLSRGGPTIHVHQVRSLISLGADVLVRQALGDSARDTVGDLSEFRTVLRSLPPDPCSIFDGVVGTLSRFRQASYPMAVVTNKPADLSHSLLESLDLAKYFGAIVGGDTAPHSKPHPAPIEWALERLGCSKDRALLIGDSDVDALAARACTIPFVLYEEGYGPARCAPADIADRFREFGHLPDKIAKLSHGLGWPVP